MEKLACCRVIIIVTVVLNKIVISCCRACSLDVAMKLKLSSIEINLSHLDPLTSSCFLPSYRDFPLYSSLKM